MTSEQPTNAFSEGRLLQATVASRAATIWTSRFDEPIQMLAKGVSHSAICAITSSVIIYRTVTK